MGNPIQKLNDKISLVASKKTWIEGLAIQQLNKTAELEGMKAVAGMPDVYQSVAICDRSALVPEP